MKQFQLSFMPVGACNMTCPNCTQTPWRGENQDYQMTPDEVTAICDSVRRQGLRFRWAHITGGEPALWKYLYEGLGIIHESGLFEHTEVWSNCRRTAPVIAAYRDGLLDHVQTQSANGDKRGIAAYRKAGVKLSVIDPSAHQVHPDHALDGVLPAACGCDRIMVTGGRVWSCANAYSNMRRLGIDPIASGLWAPIESDWAAAMDRIDRYNMQACRVCLANGHVSKQAPVGKVR